MNDLPFRLFNPTEEDIEKRPRYVDERYYADGTVFWRYVPPHDARKEGIVEGQVLGVGEGEKLSAYRKADELNAIVDEWRIERRYGSEVARLAKESVPKKLKDSTLKSLCEAFLEYSWRLKVISPAAAQGYYWGIPVFLEEEYKGIPLALYDMEELGRSDAEELYQQFVSSRGTVNANTIMSVMRRVYNQAIEWGFTYVNPFARFTLPITVRDAVEWTDEQRQRLLDESLKSPRWARVRRCLLLACHTGMSNREAIDLTWNDIDLDERRITVTRRRKKVRLEIPEELAEVMRGWPREHLHVLHQHSGKPMTPSHLSKDLQRLREAAGLPSDLKVTDAFKRSSEDGS